MGLGVGDILEVLGFIKEIEAVIKKHQALIDRVFKNKNDVEALNNAKDNV